MAERAAARRGRDIKLENTLLDAGHPLPNVKLCDFGYSKNEFVDSRPKTVSGTPDYIAPEVLLNDQYDGMKADIWSCGVMLYVMLTGALRCAAPGGRHPQSQVPRRRPTARAPRAAVLPFAKRGDDRSNNLVRLQQLFPRIVAADYEQPRRVSEDCRALLRSMLTPDPNRRITIPEIMRHPWCAPPVA